MSTTNRTGVLHQYDIKKGFGWIIEENGRQHFAHVTGFNMIPEVGMRVTFDVVIGRKGPMAANIRPAVSAAAELLNNVASDVAKESV